MDSGGPAHESATASGASSSLLSSSVTSPSNETSPRSHPVAFGLDTFGDTTVDRLGHPVHHVQKIATTVRTLGLDCFDLKCASGPTPHENLQNSIDLYVRKVMPHVRELLDEAGYEEAMLQAVSRL